MEDNKRVKTFLLTAGILVLLVILAYPLVKSEIVERRKKELSLEQVAVGSGKETGGMEDYLPEGGPNEEHLEDGQQGSVSLKADETEPEEKPEVFFAVEGFGDLRVSLWQSDNGSCYLFFPGFAKGKDVVLAQADETRVFIGDSEVRQGDVLKDISAGKAYGLTLQDRDGEEVVTTSLAIMYSSRLPVLSLTTHSGGMEIIDEDKIEGEEGAVRLYDETGTLVYEGEAESIRGRGNSTWGLSKKPYQFKLCEAVDFFGFGSSKSFNLLANGYDETRLRNQVALGLAAELGMAYVPQGQMVDLYINDIYHGNYYLTEKIRIGEQSVAIRDMEDVVNSIYSPDELEMLERFSSKDGSRRWTAADYGDLDITGGYLFERELKERYKEEISGFATKQGDHYTLKSPAYASKEQVDYIAGLMQEFQDAACQEDGVHPVTGKHYSQYIDVTSFVQKYLVEEMSKNYDGGVTSSFFYKPQDEVSHKIYAGPVWDYDVAFGNCNLDEIASNPVGITKLSDHIYGTDLFAALYEKEDFYGQIVALYREKGLPYFEWLLNEGIDRMVEESRDSAAMDSIRWEDLENRYQYYEDYDNSVRYLKYFIEKRKEFLNEVWLEGEIYHNVSFMVEGEVWQVNCVKDGETAGNEPIPSRYSSLFMGWATEEGIPYDRFKPVYEDMVFYPSWQELSVKDVVLDQ